MIPTIQLSGDKNNPTPKDPRPEPRPKNIPQPPPTQNPSKRDSPRPGTYNPQPNKGGGRPPAKD